MKQLLTVVGARPQFIKHAPMQLELQKYFRAITVHTGQHYDANMSDVFFNELGLSKPDYMLEIGGDKSQGAQTADMMVGIERIAQQVKPDMVLVYGDTNSTLAAVLVAAKMCIPIVHVEAGLRSFNRNMPEEINRIIADEFAGVLFCPTEHAIVNLKKEGIDHDGIFLCGDVMCDTLKLVEPGVERKLNEEYYFVTLHRPYNVDDEVRLGRILKVLNGLNRSVIFPVHPRTVARMERFGLSTGSFENITFVDPVGYIESISYQKFAKCIITDSGGMQKEAYMLQKKCITLRSETEWTETLEHGWNTLVFDDIESIPGKLEEPTGVYFANRYGTGEAAKEIVGHIRAKYGV